MHAFNMSYYIYENYNKLGSSPWVMSSNLCGKLPVGDKILNRRIGNKNDRNL